MTEGVSIIIPTLNGGARFKQCLEAVKAQRCSRSQQLIVVDSGSSDGTIETAQGAGALVIRIERKDFHHSRTRNYALQHAIHDRVIFMTQDAVPTSADWLEIISGGLEPEGVAAAYGRHLPHDDADLFAWFETTAGGEFLGDRVLVQELGANDDFRRMPYGRAVRLARCDNVCAIYRRAGLLKVPFPDLVFGEDMAWAKAALSRGMKIKYDPAIQVRHSHNRGPDYRFRRALIANFVTAEILGRVREDLSFLTGRDLERASEILEAQQARIAGGLAGREGAERRRISPLWSILDRRPGLLSALTLAQRRLAVLGGRRRWLHSFPGVAAAKINLVLSRVSRAFPQADDQSLLACAEQMIGSIKGTLYGEVAASHRIKGRLPPDLDSIVRPFLNGV